MFWKILEFWLNDFWLNGIYLKEDDRFALKSCEILSYRKSLYEDEKSTPPLYVMAPSRMSEYLMPYHCKFESILQSLVQVKNEHLLPSPLESGKNYWPHTGANKVRSSAFMLSFIPNGAGFVSFWFRDSIYCEKTLRWKTRFVPNLLLSRKGRRTSKLHQTSSTPCVRIVASKTWRSEKRCTALSHFR